MDPTRAVPLRRIVACQALHSQFGGFMTVFRNAGSDAIRMFLSDVHESRKLG